MRDHAHTLSDFRVPTLSIECEPCGRFGRYNIARLMEKYCPSCGTCWPPIARKPIPPASATGAGCATAPTAGSRNAALSPPPSPDVHERRAQR
jgi:hypothetical protein